MKKNQIPNSMKFLQYAPTPDKMHPALPPEQDNYLTIAYTKLDSLHVSHDIPSHTKSFAKKAFERLCIADIDGGGVLALASNLEVFIGASLALANEQFDDGMGLTLEEISLLISVPVPRLVDGRRLLLQSLGISFRAGADAAVRFALDICQVLQCPLEFTDMATEVAANVYEGGYLAESVVLTACCAVLMVGHILKRIVAVPDLARITEVDGRSLRAMYRRLVRVRAEIVDPKWRDPWDGVGYLQVMEMELQLGFYH